MLDDRLTEQRNPRSSAIDELSPLELVDLINGEDRTVAEAVRSQRLAIARAIANKPDVLLADEPTGALDPEAAQAVYALILKLCEEEGCTLVFVTHDERLAEGLPRRLDARGFIRHEATV